MQLVGLQFVIVAVDFILTCTLVAIFLQAKDTRGRLFALWSESRFFSFFILP